MYLLFLFCFFVLRFVFGCGFSFVRIAALIKGNYIFCSLIIVAVNNFFQSLDKVVMEMSTCDEPRPPNGPSPIATASGQRSVSTDRHSLTWFVSLLRCFLFSWFPLLFKTWMYINWKAIENIISFCICFCLFVFWARYYFLVSACHSVKLARNIIIYKVLS